ncbi:DUF4253 domain-containing protein [Actinomadura kijaniata]|uniref:DUF4253 domain-containing protein n=1 Tax=Actinomadura kijaniata TaxID=46161 RepID=UPI00082D57DC|nr:DUF4253 domain-containing protein [Actinomadura kijaniata]
MSLGSLPPGLPPGRLVTPSPEFADERWADRPVLWVSDGPVVDSGELWTRLYEQREETGLYPLMLETLLGTPERPWHAGELGHVPVRAVDALDAGEVLRHWWEPWPEPWPGLADAGVERRDPDAAARKLARRFASGDDRHLGLVPVARGADALAECGWRGRLGHAHDAGRVAAVVRSWEERFGARVVMAGPDTLDLSVAAPPRTLEHARRVAAEHLAFRPDYFDLDDLDHYAEELVDDAYWAFLWNWWD